ncbi:MAG TPA: helix-turn-helix transcriptional regulator [Pseudonocardiaceae bacterium]
MTKLRRELGAALAAYLDASALTQGDLARETNYHRTSISHIQAGRQFPDRDFWEKADRALGAAGALVAHYDKVCDEEAALKRAEFDREQAERRTRVKAISPSIVRVSAESAPIDADYVEGLRREIKNLVHLDQQYGGAAAAPVIVQAYKQMRHRVNTSEIRNGLHRDVYSALSEVAEVAGWSLHDSANDSLAEQVNHESLSLARMAGDRSMELFVLQNMSMRAESLGRPHESINVSRLVLGSDRRLSPRLEALFRLRLARSYGLLQADDESRRQLGRAHSLFEDGVRADDPQWSWWVNNAQLCWFEGAVRVDLGMKTESVDFLEQSAHAIPEPRMNFIYRAWVLYGYALNESWSNVDRAIRELISDVGIFQSRLAMVRLGAAVNLIEHGNAPSTIRDLAEALRQRLTNPI